MVNLVLIDDAQPAHDKFKEWLDETKPEWATDQSPRDLIHNQVTNPDEWKRRYVAVSDQLAVLSGPTIIILDCCLNTTINENDSWRAMLWEKSIGGPLTIHSRQTEGVVLGRKLASVHPGPLLIVVATTMGVSRALRLLLTPADVGRQGLVKITESSAVMDGTDAVENLADIGAYMSALLQKWDSWQNSPPYTGPVDEIRTLLQLYGDCWCNMEWDDACDPKVPLEYKQFAHGQFSQCYTHHARAMMRWLFGEDTSVSFCGNSLKALFMVDHDAASPSRYRVVTKAVKSEYLTAALQRLGIKSPLQTGVASWFLPVTPGAAFLLSLKAFLYSLIEDHTPEKARPKPKSVDWKMKCEGGSVHYSIEVQLADLTESGANQLLTGQSGAARSLERLRRAHTDGVSATKAWSSLFRVRSEGPIVATTSYENGKILIKWRHPRR